MNDTYDEQANRLRNLQQCLLNAEHNLDSGTATWIGTDKSLRQWRASRRSCNSIPAAQELMDMAQAHISD